MLGKIKDLLRPGPRVPGPRFVIHRNYQLETSFAQYDARRPFRILSYLRKRRLLRRGTLRRPRPANITQLELAHTKSYLRSMEEAGALKPILGFDLDAATQEKFLNFQRLVCGGTLRAARIAWRRQDVAVNLGGGFHHASENHGSGFCVFNDVAMAINALRAKGVDCPVLVVDLDLHDGDGTRTIFADDETVHTFSIHNKDLGSTQAAASTSVALGTDIDDQTYLAALDEHLPPVIENFQPGLVFYLSGSDPFIDDKLGDWRISLEGLLQRDKTVMALTAGRPRVILLAGGYGPRAWRHGAAFFSWLLSGNSSLDIPLELELPVDHYRRLTGLMKQHRGLMMPEEQASTQDNDWGLTEDDLGPAGRPAETRFLGLLSTYAVEMAVEEYGLLPRLRRLGFKDLNLSVDLSDPLGHTLRIKTAGLEPLVVFETRLRIDRDSYHGLNLLSVEWLLIQDTRSRFEIDRPLLPGQKYPGLGLLRDTVAVLVVMCERLDLDGLIFTPSHFHLAAMARPLGMSFDPQKEGQFQALRELFKNVRLKEASVLVETAGVLDEETGRALKWEPSAMIVPVAVGQKAYFESKEYLDQVQQAKELCQFRLAGN